LDACLQEGFGALHAHHPARAIDISELEPNKFRVRILDDIQDHYNAWLRDFGTTVSGG
jgi:hypothetical protein